MLDILIQLDILGQLILVSVHDHAHIPAFLCLFKKLLMLALTPADDRC